MARENYLPFLAGQKDVALGLYNRTRATTDALAKKYHATVFADLGELAAWKPTAALVLTSETCRYEYARELIEKGVPRLFLEKPLVAAKGQAHVSEDDFQKGRTLLELATKNRCETAMIFNYRFFQQTVAAKKAAQERDFGKLIHAVAQVHYACWSHAIDLIRYFAGNVVEITALSGKDQRTSEEVQITATDVVAAFRMENGAAGTILGTAGMKWQHPLYELVLTFEHGRLHLRDLDGTLEILDGRGDFHETRSLSRHNSRWKQYEESFGCSLAAYLDSLRKGTPPPVPWPRRAAGTPIRSRSQTLHRRAPSCRSRQGISAMRIVKQLGNCQPVIAEIPRPKPAAGEVLIRTAASALCGSEMHSYRKEGNEGGNFGHEAAGTVEELGAGVKTLTVGQRVGVSAIAGCGQCEECQRGRYTWCGHWSFFQHMHAEYFVIPALACHVLPDDVPWDIGVLITGDGLGVPVHTARKISGKDIKTIAIFGLGPIGPRQCPAPKTSRA